MGISPLMLAAMNGHTQAVKLLIDMGSDINAQIETNRNTALTLACFQGKADVVSLLLDRKANIEHRAKTGFTPLMEAASGGYENVGRVLIDKGADVNAPPVPVSKETALTIASEKGHFKFVQLLIENGATIDVRNKKGYTPLWFASCCGHLEVCHILVTNGANADIEDSKRISCLMAAFRKGHIKIVKYLVKHVKQFPSDTECMKYIATLTDKELAKKCQQCMEIIINAKEKQAQEANKIANSLLKEIDAEKVREKSKKAAAARKREKRKMKKKMQKESTDDKLEHSIINISATNTTTNITNNDDNNHDEDDNQMENCESEEIKFIREDAQNLPNKNKKKKTNKNKKSFVTPSIQPQSLSLVKGLFVTAENIIPSSNTSKDIVQSSIKTDEKVYDTKLLKNDDATQTKKQSSDTLLKHQSTLKPIFQQPQESSLAALDDFEPIQQIKFKKPLKQSTCINFTANEENDWKQVVSSNLTKQKRIQVPNDKFMRVIGRGNNNIKAINEVTGATLEIERQQASTSQVITTNDKFIIIKGTNDSVKYATQLLIALINDSDLDLVNLLPNNKTVSNPTISTAISNINLTTTPKNTSSVNNSSFSGSIVINSPDKAFKTSSKISNCPTNNKILTHNHANYYNNNTKQNKNSPALSTNKATVSPAITTNTTSSTSLSWATNTNPTHLDDNTSIYNPLIEPIVTQIVPTDIHHKATDTEITTAVNLTMAKSSSNTTINSTIKRNFAEVAKQSLNAIDNEITTHVYKRNTSISPSLLISATTSSSSSLTTSTKPILSTSVSSNHVKILKSDNSKVNISDNKNTQTISKIDGSNIGDEHKNKQQMTIKSKPISVVQPSYSSISQSAKQSQSTPSLISNDLSSNNINSDTACFLGPIEHHTDVIKLLSAEDILLSSNSQQPRAQQILSNKNSSLNQFSQQNIQTIQKLINVSLPLNNASVTQQQIIYHKNQKSIPHLQLLNQNINMQQQKQNADPIQQSDIHLPSFLNCFSQLSPISTQRQQQYLQSPPILPLIQQTNQHQSLVTPAVNLYSSVEQQSQQQHNFLNDYNLNDSITSRTIDEKKWLSSEINSQTSIVTSTATTLAQSQNEKPIAPIGHERHGRQQQNHQQQSVTPVTVSQQNSPFFKNQFNESIDNDNIIKCKFF